MTKEEIKRLASLANSMNMDANLILMLCDQEVLTSEHRGCAETMKKYAQNIMDLHNTLVRVSNGWVSQMVGMEIQEPKGRVNFP